jgi:hypothetical protein
MSSEYTKRCPNCYSDDLAPLMVALYVCGNCCYPFAIARAIDLRELSPQPAPSLSEQAVDEYNRRVI